MEQGNNFYNAVKGVMGLFSPVNKAKKGISDEDDSVLLPEFESKLKDDEILKLVAQYKSAYDSYFTKDIQAQQKANLDYWLGKQFNEMQTAGTKRPLVDNLLFEAIETFLPIATRGNPQANVFADGTDQGEDLAHTISNALLYQADRQRLRMKLKSVTRNWLIYLVGAVEVVWDANEQDMDTDVILPTRLILDPFCKIEVGGRYKGEFLGIKTKVTARRLTEMFPKKAAEIKAIVNDSLGTKITYTKWWTNRDLFFTYEGIVLGKFKHPHWNYSGETKVIDPETQEETSDLVEGQNHFSQPEYPVLFLSVFSLGKQPHDETSLIYQTIPQQDVVNKREQQIDRNVDAQNNGVILSGTAFTKEQASEAALSLSRGNPLWVPSGPIDNAYKRDSAPALSSDVFRHLEDSRDQIRNIFGTSGSTPEGVEDQKTARGKILINQLDASRIGGGVTEYIEQLACSIYNWYVQMMYVYYTEEHSFSIVGPKAQEMMQIKNTDFHTKLHISVKDGSLIPKDPLTKRNEAMDLWSANGIAPIPFYAALDYPNPYESAKELVMWQMIQKGQLPPQMMFPDLETPPNAAPGQNTSPAVNPQEAKAEENVPPAGAEPPTGPQITGQQLIQSVPIH